VNLTAIDWLLIAIYFVFVLGIGVALKRQMKTSTDYFLAGRSIRHGFAAWHSFPQTSAPRK